MADNKYYILEVLMSKTIDSNKYYDIKDEQFICCGETQFKYVCKAHGNTQDCYYCSFNPDEACDC